MRLRLLQLRCRAVCDLLRTGNRRRAVKKLGGLSGGLGALGLPGGVSGVSGVSHEDIFVIGVDLGLRCECSCGKPETLKLPFQACNVGS